MRLSNSFSFPENPGFEFLFHELSWAWPTQGSYYLLGKYTYQSDISCLTKAGLLISG